MKLREYLKSSDDDIKAVAKRANVCVGYIYQIAKGGKKPGPKVAKAIELATNGAVSRADLRPDIYADFQK